MKIQSLILQSLLFTVFLQATLFGSASATNALATSENNELTPQPGTNLLTRNSSTPTTENDSTPTEEELKNAVTNCEHKIFVEGCLIPKQPGESTQNLMAAAIQSRNFRIRIENEKLKNAQARKDKKACEKYMKRIQALNTSIQYLIVECCKPKTAPSTK